MWFFFRWLSGWGAVIGVPLFFLLASLYPLLPHNLEKLRTCAFWYFFHFDCPGCGLTRAMSALAHGSLRESIDFHPMAIPIALALIFWFFKSLGERIFGYRLSVFRGHVARDLILSTFLVGLFAQWMVKILLVLS